MKTEYEAKFLNINKSEIRKCLKNIGAILVRPEFKQRRTVFNLPKENHNLQTWLRVRDEGDKITLSLKIIDGDQIHNQKENQIIVSDFESACQILRDIGEAIFGSAGKVLSLKYGIPEDIVNNEFPRLVFGEVNPFPQYLKNNK